MFITRPGLRQVIEVALTGHTSTVQGLRSVVSAGAGVAATFRGLSSSGMAAGRSLGGLDASLGRVAQQGTKAEQQLLAIRAALAQIDQVVPKTKFAAMGEAFAGGLGYWAGSALITAGYNLNNLFNTIKRSLLDSAEAAAKFDHALKEVATIAGPDAPLNEWKDAILEMSAARGKPATELTEALYQTLSNAVDAKDAMGVMTEAAVLANAGVTSVDEAVKSLTAAMNIYGYSADRAREVSNAFFFAIKDGRYRIEDLSAAIGRWGSASARAGVELQDALAIYSTVTQSGKQPRVAGQQTGAFFDVLTSPTPRAQAAWQESFGGMTPRQMIEQQGFVDFLDTVRQKVQQTPNLLEKLFPERSTRAIADILFNRSWDLLQRQFTGSREWAARDEVGKADETMMSSSLTKIEQYKETVAGLKIALGEVWIEAFGPVMTFFAGIARAIANTVRHSGFLRAVLKTLAVALTAVVGLLAVFLLNLGRLWLTMWRSIVFTKGLIGAMAQYKVELAQAAAAREALTAAEKRAAVVALQQGMSSLGAAKRVGVRPQWIQELYPAPNAWNMSGSAAQWARNAKVAGAGNPVITQGMGTIAQSANVAIGGANSPGAMLGNVAGAAVTGGLAFRGIGAVLGGGGVTAAIMAVGVALAFVGSTLHDLYTRKKELEESKDAPFKEVRDGLESLRQSGALTNEEFERLNTSLSPGGVALTIGPTIERYQGAYDRLLEDLQSGRLRSPMFMGVRRALREGGVDAAKRELDAVVQAYREAQRAKEEVRRRYGIAPEAEAFQEQMSETFEEGAFGAEAFNVATEAAEEYKRALDDVARSVGATNAERATFAMPTDPTQREGAYREAQLYLNSLANVVKLRSVDLAHARATGASTAKIAELEENLAEAKRRYAEFAGLQGRLTVMYARQSIAAQQASGALDEKKLQYQSSQLEAAEDLVAAARKLAEEEAKREQARFSNDVDTAQKMVDKLREQGGDMDRLVDLEEQLGQLREREYEQKLRVAALSEDSNALGEAQNAILEKRLELLDQIVNRAQSQQKSELGYYQEGLAYYEQYLSLLEAQGAPIGQRRAVEGQIASLRETIDAMRMAIAQSEQTVDDPFRVQREATSIAKERLGLMEKEIQKRKESARGEQEWVSSLRRSLAERANLYMRGLPTLDDFMTALSAQFGYIRFLSQEFGGVNAYRTRLAGLPGIGPSALYNQAPAFAPQFTFNVYAGTHTAAVQRWLNEEVRPAVESMTEEFFVGTYDRAEASRGTTRGGGAGLGYRRGQ